MQKEFLEECLTEGMSLEAIGKKAGKHESTVSHWLKKYGLEAHGSAVHAPNGKVDPERLQSLAAEGASIQEMGEAFGVRPNDHPVLAQKVEDRDSTLGPASGNSNCA